MTLNITELAREGERYRRQSRRRNYLFAAACFLIFALGSLLWIGVWPPPGALLRYEADTWHRMPYCGVPTKTEVSASGDLWVNARLPGRLCRYDESGKTAFNPRDISPNAVGMGDFALDGNLTWATIGNGVARYDGDQWQLFPEALSETDGYVLDIAVNDLGIFVSEEHGNLLHFDGSSWSHWRLADLLPGVQETTPRYARLEAEGTELWILYYGLWHFDGAQWELVESIPDDWLPFYRRVGTEPKTLWMSDGISLLRFGVHGERDEFPFSDIGLPSDGDVARMMTDGSLLWFATSDGLLTYDGNQWKPASIAPVSSEYPIQDIAFYQNTPVAAIATNESYDNDFEREYLSNYLLASYVPLLVLFALALLIIPSMRANVRRTGEVRALLLEALPDLKEHVALYRTNRALTRVTLGFVGVVIATMGLSLMGVPLLPTLVISFALIFGINVLPILLNLRNPSLDSANRSYVRRISLQLSLLTAMFMLVVVLLIPLIGSILSTLLPEWPLTGMIELLIASWLTLNGLELLMALPSILIGRQFLAAGQYDGALARIEAWKNFFPSRWHRLSFESYVLTLAGRFAEAEPMLRQTLSEAQNHSLLIITDLANLALALDAEEREEDALNLLIAALKMAPEKRTIYRELAHFYLRRNTHLATALELTTVMMHFSKKPRLNISNQTAQWAITLSIRAWALAAVGDFGNADKAIKQAFSDSDRREKPQLAMLHLVAGKIEHLKLNAAAAREHFATAVALDPNGLGAKWASAATTDLTI